ncbi:hypothetical protein AB0I10_34485 [Streptomyces sp. NPDC050636]|uniref:hypothetical protein n=1 Tax=Streptomyces sp. NPDC050636 TaxID=3154510 RepID=UPI003444230D
MHDTKALGEFVSLAINPDAITAVLLPDGWHDVRSGTFVLDAYEYVEGDDVTHGGGQSGICATGFEFATGREWIAGPLTSILAVRKREG